MDHERQYWRDKTVLVTGGAGFLGSYVVELLEGMPCARIVVPRSAAVDLVDREAVRELYQDTRPDVVVHLAARVGGIGANQRNPGAFFFENLSMGMNLIEEARRIGVAKFVQIGTVCAYPGDAPVPLREDDLWDGYPEPTNAPYGIAKKALLVQLQAYRAQYGFDGIYLLPANLYGPRDSFDLETGHVIPALIRKFVEARDRGVGRIVIWGTGAASRDFLYVEDCARAVVLAAERYSGPAPINIGTGREIRIRELVALVQDLVGFDGEICYDSSRPDGQPRRALDTGRAQELLGFEASVPLEEGIRRTVEWYEQWRAGSGGVRAGASEEVS